MLYFSTRQLVGDKIITFVKDVTVPLTYTCSEMCGYCGFRRIEDYLTVPYSTIKTYKKAVKQGVTQVLLTAGERPDKFNFIRTRLDVWGFTSYVEYIYTICELALLEGLLPCLDIGYLTLKEMESLKNVFAVVQIMLETTSKKLLNKDVHKNAPRKDPSIRLKMIEEAGKLQIPLNTGLLIGIGESKEDWKESLSLIRDLHLKYDHIQRVTLQNFVPQKGTLMEKAKPPKKTKMLEAVRLAKKILPPDILIHVPLNLNNDFLTFIRAGVTTFGEYPLSKDYLCPEKPFPKFSQIRKKLAVSRYSLKEDFAISQKFLEKNWYSPMIGQVIDRITQGRR